MGINGHSIIQPSKKLGFNWLNHERCGFYWRFKQKWKHLWRVMNDRSLRNAGNLIACQKYKPGPRGLSERTIVTLWCLNTSCFTLSCFIWFISKPQQGLSQLRKNKRLWRWGSLAAALLRAASLPEHPPHGPRGASSSPSVTPFRSFDLVSKCGKKTPSHGCSTIIWKLPFIYPSSPLVRHDLKDGSTNG
jgi:hypothetical protein